MNERLTQIELYIIEAVKKKREALNISQRALSISAGLDESYVGQAESPGSRAKYNFNHINEFAKVLKCSVADFMPDPYMESDCIAEYKKYHPR